MALPTDRTSSSTIPEHVNDHNTLHAQHNDLEGHAADTTVVHGITDTAALETTTGSSAKVAAHEADTTSVHGITDTSALALTSHGHASLVLTPQTAPAYQAGLLFYNSDDQSMGFYNNEADVTLNVGQETWVRVRNSSGATIANGAAVYINGNHAGSGLPTVALARADVRATAGCIGLATHSIENNTIGFVTTLGIVHGLNTVAFTNGDRLFLSATTAGTLTVTEPVSPNLSVGVAFVTKAAGAPDGTLDVLLRLPGPPLAHASTHDAGGGDALAIDAAAATGSLRTLGTGATQAAVGSHGHSGAYVAATDFDAAGDLMVGTGSDTYAKLTKGSALQVLRVNSGATALEYADASGSDWVPGDYGDGSDGVVNFDGSTTVLGLAPAASVYTLTRDVFLASGSQISGSAIVKTAHFRIFCRGTLTIGASAAVTGDGAAGVLGVNGSALAVKTIGPNGQGGTGGVGGNGITGTAMTISSVGGTGGTSGASSGGGSGGGQAGGTATLLATSSVPRSVVTAVGLVALGNAVGWRGGGGGGGGGGLILIYHTKSGAGSTFTAATNVPGGGGGAAQGAGRTGVAGSNGTIYEVVH